MEKISETIRKFIAITKEIGPHAYTMFMVAVLCLILNNYMPARWLNRIVEYRTELSPLQSAVLQSAGFSLMHFITLFLIPCIALLCIIHFFSRHTSTTSFPAALRHCGLGWNHQSAFIHIFALAYIILLPLLIWAAQREEFQEMYPFFFYARYGMGHLLTWWFFYGLYYLGVEFFFRGFLLFGFFPRIGNMAILVSTIPYVMVHFAKPPGEAAGSIIAGILLSYMALRSGSIWGGFLLHWAVGMTMDALSVYYSGGFIVR